ncbi:MAG: hypothetical protein KA928_01820 [Longilinea sp.]|nr:hypothetical protein [Longilinea sp.]
MDILIKKSRWRTLWLPLLVIPVGGAIMIALTLALYLGIYLLLESIFFSSNPQGFPAGSLRMGCTIALVGLYLILLRTKLPDLLKAIFLTGPLAASIITTGFFLSELPFLSVTIMLAVVVICGFLLFRFKKPWFYYYAGAIGALLALAYAWPEAWRF